MSKILFIITQSEIGGAQRYLLELAPYLAQKGHQIIVAAGEGDGELFTHPKLKGSDPVSFNGVRPQQIKVPNLVRDFNPVKDILAVVGIFKIIKKERPDILFLQSTKAGFVGSFAAKLYNIPPYGGSPAGRQYTTYKIRVIYRIGGWAFNDPRSWWMNKILFWMEKVSARWKDVIIVNSEFDRQTAIDKKIAPANKIVKIYNGIDPGKLNFLPRENAKNFILSKISHDRYSYTTSPPLPPPLLSKERGDGLPAGRQGGEVVIVGTIANLYATKGIEYLIESARILYQLPVTNYQLLFIVVGEGRERPRLEALIEKYNLEDKFFLVGRIPNASQYLKAFDIFVLPSVKEGFPWALLEAMAAEVAIVATKVGAVPEVVQDIKEGLLADPRDSKALAEKILKLIQNAHDRENYVKNARGRLAQFTLQKMLEESEKLIKDL